MLNLSEKIIAIILFLVATFLFIMSIRSLKQKGFLLNNAYIYATQKERETMNKKPYYQQSAIVFSLIGIIFLLNAVALFFSIDQIFYVVIFFAIATIIYAIVSSAVIEKTK